MAGIAHLGIGLAARPLAPKVPLWVLLVAAEAIDLLWTLFYLLKIETFEESPWSHGLFMALVWSAGGGLIAARVFKRARAGVVVGLVVFSHWLIDFITHPMFGGPPDLTLFLAGSPKVGLGLYSFLQPWPWLLTVIEFGVVLAGAGVYWRGAISAARSGRSRTG